MNPPELSIVIPTHNRTSLLHRLLGSLSPEIQGVKDVLIEVIVSFDGSRQSIDVPRELEQYLVVCDGPQGGPARARNRGASFAQAPLLVFIDDDCTAAPKCLAEYLRAFKEESDVVLEGKTTTLDARTSLAQIAPLNEHGGFLWSCNFAIPTAVFRVLGGFDPRFQYATMEDVEFRTRLLKSGFRTRFIPEATVYHGLRTRGDWRYFKRHLLSEDLFEMLHPEMTISPWHHWYMALYGAVFHTLPGLFRFRGRGILYALREHAFFTFAGLRKVLRPLTRREVR